VIFHSFLYVYQCGRLFLVRRGVANSQIFPGPNGSWDERSSSTGGVTTPNWLPTVAFFRWRVKFTSGFCWLNPLLIFFPGHRMENVRAIFPCLLFWLHYRMGLEGNPSPLEAWTMRPRQQLFLFIPATTLLSPNLKGWETHLDMFFCLKHDFDANLTFRVDLYGKHVNGTHRYITLHYPLPRWARPFFHVPCPVYPPFFAGEIPSFQCCPPFTHLWAHSTDCRFPLMIDAWVPIEYIYIYTHCRFCYNYIVMIQQQPNTYIHTYIYICTYIHIYAYAYIYICICTYTHIYIYLYMYVCMYYTYIFTTPLYTLYFLACLVLKSHLFRCQDSMLSG